MSRDYPPSLPLPTHFVCHFESNRCSYPGAQVIIKETETTFDGSRVEVTGLDLGRGLILVNLPPFDVISDSTLNLFVPCLSSRALRLSGICRYHVFPQMWLEFISSTCIPSLLKVRSWHSAALIVLLFFLLHAVVAVAPSAVLYSHH